MTPSAHQDANREWNVVQGDLLARIGDTDNFVRAIFSGRRRNYQPQYERIDLRPVTIKSEPKLQVVSTSGNHIDTKNFTFEDFIKLGLFEAGFANFLVETRSECIEVRVGKKGQVFSKTSRVYLEPSPEHDRQKKRYLAENDPLLIAVGISDTDGRIKPSMRDKYLQVEEFLRIVDNSIGNLCDDREVIRLVDLGCGHAYLTFATLRFFQIHNRKVSLIGVDAKSEMRDQTSELRTPWVFLAMCSSSNPPLAISLRRRSMLSLPYTLVTPLLMMPLPGR